MALQIRRGLNSERLTKVLQNGEIAWTTDTKKLYIGDGVTTGGTNILQSAQGIGLSWNPVTEQLDLTASTLFINSSNVTETTNLFHTAQRAQDAAAALFTNAAGDHVGISFVYDSVNHKLTATVAQENIEDRVGAVLVAGNATNTGITFTYDATADTNNRINATVDAEYIQDQVNVLFGAGVHSGISFTYNDNLNSMSASVNLSGNLSGNLSLNNYNISGTGNINITGNVTNIKTVSQTVETPEMIGNPLNGVVIKANGSRPLSVNGVGTLGQSSGQVYFNINAAKGTLSAPTTTTGGDGLGGIAIQGYNGSDYKPASLIVAAWEASALLTDTFPKSILRLITGAGGSNLNVANFTSNGVFDAPVQKTTVYSVAGTAIPSASSAGAGARAFVSDATANTFGTAYTGGGANSVPVYSNGTAWYIG